ncbi:adenylyltransferase/cytidyltransferase family protein [Candidatus Gracilibacteria bacterium]|nr:adenylyltransferase/cytidyltransferase family protein [Candidatus Gracilibacteria bacterium]
MTKIAVFLGRFQPFHIGHMSIVEKIFADYDSLILIIGSSDKSGTDENPWNLQEREEIIRASIPLELQERMDIVGLADVPDDDVWCENLKALLPSEVVLFTGNEWVRDICQRHGITTDWIDSYDIDISGTKIREMIQKGEDVSQWTNII